MDKKVPKMVYAKMFFMMIGVFVFAIIPMMIDLAWMKLKGWIRR